MSKKSAAEKLRMILDFTKLESLQQLAEEIGANKQNMYDITKGKCGISKNMKERSLDRYPNISKDWLDDLSDVMMINSPSITTHATGNSKASVNINSNNSGDKNPQTASSDSELVENITKIAVLEKENQMLREQIEFLKTLINK